MPSLFAAITTMPARTEHAAALRAQLAALSIPAHLFSGAAYPGRAGQRENALIALAWLASVAGPHDWLLYFEDDVTLTLAFRQFLQPLAAVMRDLGALGLANRRPPVVSAVPSPGARYHLCTIVGKPFTDAVLLRPAAVEAILAEGRRGPAVGGSDHLFWTGLAKGRQRYAQLVPSVALDLRLPSLLSPDARTPAH